MKQSIKTTQKEIKRMEYASNQLIILKVADLKQEDYNLIQFNLGMQFLLNLYEQDSRWIKVYQSDKFFWNWWRSEWDLWQSLFIFHYRIHRVKITYENWVSEMSIIAHDGSIEVGFQNYLKTIKNVNISKNRKTAVV